MRGRVRVAIVALALVGSACSSATATPAMSIAPAATPSPAASSQQAPSQAPSTQAPAGDFSTALFGTNFQPPTGATTGGTLVIGDWQAPPTLNPLFSTTLITLVATEPAMRGLVTITSDGKYIADLAGDVPSIENGGVVVTGTTFTVAINVRPGLKWSDGTPLTLNDYKATWAWATDPAQTGCTGCDTGWNEINRIDVSADGLSAVLHFKELYASWLGFLASPFFQAAWLKTIPPADGAKSMPVSSAIASVPVNGPFVFTDASPSEVDYAQNPDWAGGVDLAVGGQTHVAYLAGLKLEIFGSKDGEIAAFKSGAIDLTFGLGQADFPAVQATDPSVGSTELQPVWQYEHLDLNNDPTHARGDGLWLTDVRTALAMAIDKSDLVAGLFPGQVVAPVCSPTPPSLWYAKAETCPSFSVAGANALLDSAGLTRGADGNRTFAGKEVDLELCTMSGNPTRLTELQKVQGYLAAVGLKSHVETVDASAVLFAGWDDTKAGTDCSIYRGNYDIADFAYLLGADPYGNYYYSYASDQFPELGDHSGSNDTRFSSPAMDAALSTLASDVDLSKQFADAGAVQDAYNAGIPEIPLYYSSETTGISVHVGGWPGYNPSNAGPTWNTEDWFFKP